VPYERLVNNCVAKPTVLKFKSEYELIHGVSPVADPTILACTDQQMLMTSLEADINKHYEHKPIVVIVDDEQRAELIMMLKTNKNKFLEGED
jgi:hypothetical protein